MEDKSLLSSSVSLQRSSQENGKNKMPNSFQCNKERKGKSYVRWNAKGFNS